MGKPDKAMKAFIKIPEIFSQLFNVAVFEGKKEIRPEKLNDVDTVLDTPVELFSGAVEYVERLRDTAKISDSGLSFRIILGVEEQTSVHYYMPVRDMLLDALQYDYQCRQRAAAAKEKNCRFRYGEGSPKGTKIMPVISLILYVGSRKWDGPTQLYDLFDIPDHRRKWAGQYIRNYQINLIDARHMTEEQIDRFEGDLKAFFTMLSEHYNEKKLKNIVAHHRETWYAISSVKQDDRYAAYINRRTDEEVKGGIAMPDMLDRMMAERDAQLAEKAAELKRRQSEYDRSKTRLDKMQIEVARAQRQLDEDQKELAESRKEMKRRWAELEKKQAELEERQAAFERMSVRRRRRTGARRFEKNSKELR